MKLILAALALLIAGCSASSSVVTGTVRDPIDPSEVRVYLSPPDSYEEVALIEATSELSWAVTDQGLMNDVIKGLKKEAAKLGANGVLLTSTEDRDTYGVEVTNSSGKVTGFIPSSDKAAQAIAIRTP